jgi:hypothetical protein
MDGPVRGAMLIEPGRYACGKCGGDTTYIDYGDGDGTAIYHCSACDIAEPWFAAMGGHVFSPRFRRPLIGEHYE